VGLQTRIWRLLCVRRNRAKADDISELIRGCGETEARIGGDEGLQEAFRNHEPWLEWAESGSSSGASPIPCPAHPRAHLHAGDPEGRPAEDIQRDLFADPEHGYARRSSSTSTRWTGRIGMILGDSLAVMASLARREALAGKIQMIYMDPPTASSTQQLPARGRPPRRQGQGRGPHPRAGDG